MKTDKNFKYKKMVKFTQFVTLKELKEKSTFLKIPAQTFEAGDFLNIFGISWGGFFKVFGFLRLTFL